MKQLKRVRWCGVVIGAMAFGCSESPVDESTANATNSGASAPAVSTPLPAAVIPPALNRPTPATTPATNTPTSSPDTVPAPGAEVFAVDDIAVRAEDQPKNVAKLYQVMHAKSQRPTFDELSNTLHRRIDDVLVERDIHGISFGYHLTPELRGAVCVGLGDVVMNQQLAPKLRMHAGEVGMTYTAALVLQLVDQRIVTLDTPIKRYFGTSDWFTRLPNYDDITIEHLLNHTSGIPDFRVDTQFWPDLRADDHRAFTPIERVDYILDRSAAAPAGKKWLFSATNYILLGMILEQVTGTPYIELLQTRLFEPNELAATSPCYSVKIGDIVTGYEDPVNGPMEIQGRVYRKGVFDFNPQYAWAAGGVVSSPIDLPSWWWRFCSGHVIQPSTVARAAQGIPTTMDNDRFSGLGMMLRPSPNGPALSHDGHFPGYRTAIAYYPDHVMAVSLQMNEPAKMTALEVEALLDELSAIVLSFHDRLIKAGKEG